ncbi:MAG: LytTR family DNA-binding domain-containing protein [Proteobacteria bacterium]|nr:LytTR family DNA-binding domain-containing protein [Pseudomonadota bacterium]MBU1584909.1 LytTR family DNA-binding domain-containing protein [Pseudomonadota bacterium]MBU2627427.1 LytTR family DNA-binding domain-containing protein [Pseudomonadota bacterium]
MKLVTAIIADDEENLRISLSVLLERLWPELEILGHARNGIEAVSLIERMKPDMAFLDIKMPGMTGVEVAKKVSGACKIIFITAYDQFAVQAFESEAVDYVLKPVTQKRMETTISRLKKQLDVQDIPQTLDLKIKKIIQVLENKQTPEYLRLIKVKTGSELRFVPVSQVLYFKAEDKYTIVQTASNEFLIKIPVKDLENELDPKQFWRVHRSAIVNIERIKTIKRSFTNQMIIGFDQTDHTIPVSRSYEHLFKQM